MQVSRTIWKFPLAFRNVRGDELEILMPAPNRILTLQVQNGEPTLWALVDPEADVAVYKFIVVGTGYELDGRCGDYVGTWQHPPYVWHLFRDAR